MSYWKLKRYSRNGVALLRRLQNSSNVRKPPKQFSCDKKDVESLREQLHECRKLRQDLERARLLIEMVKKRETLKCNVLIYDQEIARIHLNSLTDNLNGVLLPSALKSLIRLDKDMIFTQPVDALKVPVYYTEIKEPMDFSRMQAKVDVGAYASLDEFERDFNLIIDNCCAFNRKGDFYYLAALRLRVKVSFTTVSLFRFGIWITIFKDGSKNIKWEILFKT